MSNYESRTIEGAQSPTRYLLNSFKAKTEERRKAAPGVKQLLRFDIDHGEALHTALQFFGKDEVRYLAIK